MKEECGISAFYSKNFYKKIHLSSLKISLKNLQHRGRESAGITYFNKNFQIYKGLGLVDEAIGKWIDNLESNSSIGHVRYSTSGGKSGSFEERSEKAQPFFGIHPVLGEFTIVHNGNLPAYHELMRQYPNITETMKYGSDSEFILRYLECAPDKNWDDILKKFIIEIPGIYSLIVQVMGGNIYFMKDRYGMRPLVIGEDSVGYYLTSETVGLPIRIQSISNHYEIRAGEIWKLDRELSSQPILVNVDNYMPIYSSMCLFEYIYFQRPKSQYRGQYIKDIRYRLGKKMAELESTINSSHSYDLVVGMPNSAIPAGIGFADYLGLHYQQVIWKVKNCGRTFILPDNSERIRTIKKKIKFHPDQLVGKSVLLVDDSIVRGNTIKGFIESLRDAKVGEVHIRLISPPIKYPCFMGVDIPTVDELVANKKTIEEIRLTLDADSLKYFDIEDIYEVLGKELCTGCFTGKYPPGLLDW